MKLSRKVAHLALKKVVSLIIIAGIAVSLTACPADTAGTNGQIDDRIDPTTRITESKDNRGYSEPNQTIDATVGTAAETTSETSTEATEPTPTYNITDVDGEYEYTLYTGTPYETTLKMGASFDFFLRDPDGYCGGSTYWRIQEFADYYGWLEDGQYTLQDIEDDSLEDSGTHTLGFSNIYMIPCGDYRCYLEIGYNDEKTGDKGNQIRSITIKFIQNDSMDPAFANPAPEQMDVVINIGDHPDSYNYQCDYKTFGGSYEDIVVLQYVLYTVSRNPGDASVLFGYFQNPTIENGQWVINLP